MLTVKRWSAISSSAELSRPGRDLYTLRRPLALHTHEYVEIMCIDRGRALHFINSSKHVVEPGFLIFIRASDIHSLTPLDQEPLELTNIAIGIPEYQHLVKRYPEEMDWAFRNGEKLGFSIRLDAARHNNFEQQVNELYDAKRDQALAIDRFMLNLIAELMPHSTESAIPPDAPDWLVHAWRKIQRPEYFSEGVGAFYRLAARSREHTARTLRHYFNTTPSDCLRQARMKHAARQLAMSTRPIIEISIECGFRELAQFYKDFRAHYETTPRLYRIAHRIG